MNDEQIKEVMRLGDVIENLAWSAGKTEQYHDEPTDYAEKLPAARAELEAHLRTIGEPENTFPLNPNAASKWAHLQKHDGAEAIGVVFRTGSGSVGSLVDGSVVWADRLAHPGAKESPSRGFSLVPNYAGIDNAVSALYRRFSDWSKQGFGADDVTWCEVKADVLAIISMSQVENMAKSVNAELLGALKDARHCIGIDRDTLVDCHTNPCTGYLDPDGALAKAEYDDVIDAADAAIARAESDIEISHKHLEPWQTIETAPHDEVLLLACEFDGPGDWRIKCGYFNDDLGGWKVWGASWVPTRWAAIPAPPNLSDAARRDQTPAKVSPCAGHAVQQDADASRDWPEDFPHENGQYMNTCHVCKNTFIGHKRRVVCKVCNNGFIRAQQEADEAGGA